jgi:predicted secreted protein
MLGWATLYPIASSYHTVCALLLSLLALQWSRWGDAWSVDAWRQRAHPAPRGTPQEYGYTTWAPALVLGIVYFAAAFAKMRDTGLAWILNGTVKYHFLSDSPQAMVDWGLQLGHYPGLAIALSFCAIAVETLIIVGVSARAYRYRVAAGLGALSLMTGFVVLQGIYWPAWWILLLSFLPWHLVRPATREVSVPHGPVTMVPARQPKFAIALVIALLGQQSIVSLMRIEASPVLSTYDMYATTYGSPADYEHNAGQAYWIVGLDQTAKTHRCRISPIEAGKIERAGFAADRSLTEGLLRRCFDPSVPLQQVSLEATRVQVDWARWQLLDEPVRTLLTDPIAPEQLK